MSEETTQETQAPEAISLSDLQVLLQIVDLASSRGAFRGTELTQVGAVFDKLNAFLTHVAAQQEEARKQQEEAGEEVAPQEEMLEEALGE